MKKGVIFIFLVIVSLSFVSAGFLSNFLGKITGQPTSSPTYLCGDADLNGEINKEDVSKLIDYTFSGVKIPSEAKVDLNGDGVVDVFDVIILSDYVYSNGTAPTCTQTTPLTKSYPADATNCGNINQDTVIDINDVNKLVDITFSEAEIPAGVNADLNGDGVVDVFDVTILSDYIGGNGTAPTCIKVPCTNECASDGLLRCSGNYPQKCSDYDRNGCLEWSAADYCAYGCNNGRCNNDSGNPTCTGGWKCVNSYTRGYQLSNCSWSAQNTCGSGFVCGNGACVSNQTNQTCTDSDGGKNYYVKGYVYSNVGPQAPESGWDDCLDDNYQSNSVYSFNGVMVSPSTGTKLSETFCNSNNMYEVVIVNCSYGCVDGACVNASNKIQVTPTEETGPIELPESTYDVAGVSFADYEKQNCVNLGEGKIRCDNPGKFVSDSYGCSGCVEDKKCYPFGYRKDGYYCSDKDYLFIRQKSGSTANCVPGAESECQGELSCENNFECQSNVCANGQCITQGLLNKILNWFKGIFGG